MVLVWVLRGVVDTHTHSKNWLKLKTLDADAMPCLVSFSVRSQTLCKTVHSSLLATGSDRLAVSVSEFFVGVHCKKLEKSCQIKWNPEPAAESLILITSQVASELLSIWGRSVGWVDLMGRLSVPDPLWIPPKSMGFQGPNPSYPCHVRLTD